MKKTAELSGTALDLTTNIQENFPEFSKSFKIMPDQIFGKDSDEAHINNLKDHHNSIVELVEALSKTHARTPDSPSIENKALVGYPLYPASEDIYNRGKKEMELDPTDPSKNKTSKNENAGSVTETGYEEDVASGDLDVPGSELDDEQERIGSEDEENNYYSLGSDNHKELEEDRG